MRLLVVEDEGGIASALRQGLSESGYAVDLARDGEQGRDYALAATYDVILLDILLPRLDGLSLLRELRGRGMTTPVLLLTARDAIDDRVAGLDAGADDYLVKPFSFSELLARLRALLRRPALRGGDRLVTSSIAMDLGARSVTRGTEPVTLTPREFAVLEYLLRHPGRALSRAQIAEGVWSWEFHGEATSSTSISAICGASSTRRARRRSSRRCAVTVIGCATRCAVRRRRLGVRTALTAWYLLVLGLVIAAFSAALYWDQEQTLPAQVDRSLAGTSGQVLALIDKHVDPIKFVDGDAYRHATNHLTQAGYAVLLFDPERRPLARFGRPLQLPPDIGTTGLVTIEANVAGVEEPWRVSWQPVVRHDGVTVGYLAVGQSVEAIEQALHSLLHTLAWAAPAALGLAGLAGYGLARLAMRPVDRMTQFVRSLGANDLQRRLRDLGPDDELGRLARTLDEMLARLEASFARERRFVADAAHELRTPLTALKSRLDVVRQRERDAEAYRAAFVTIEPEVERLIRLVRDLLLLARLESTSAPWEEMPVDLSELCERIVEQMEPLARERRLTIAVDVEPGLMVSGSFDHLLRALINLLDNAIKHAHSPGRVLVEGRRNDGSICLHVANDGQSPDATLIERVGERFLRGNTDRSRETGGVGLGLAIAAEIARHHRGSLSLACKAGGGAVATLNLRTGTSR